MPDNDTTKTTKDVKDLGKALVDTTAAQEKAKKAFDDYMDSMTKSASVFSSVGANVARSLISAEEWKKHKDSAEATVQLGKNIGQAFLSAADGTEKYNKQFDNLMRGMNVSNAPIAGSINLLLKGYDEATTITRNFKGAAID